MGDCLGRMHRLAPRLRASREPARDQRWWRRTGEMVMPRLPAPERELLESELEFQGERDFTRAPSGVIHADLFRDNALFVGDELTGVIDFYYACNWPFIYDLAVVANDWCCTGSREGDRRMAAAIFSSYRGRRPLQDVERELWPVALRAAALRFWLSRVRDREFPRDGHLTHVKDPGRFRDILLRNRQGWMGWPLSGQQDQGAQAQEGDEAHHVGDGGEDH